MGRWTTWDRTRARWATALVPLQPFSDLACLAAGPRSAAAAMATCPCCKTRPALGEGGPCVLCDEVRRLQSLVVSAALPAWTARPVAGLLEGVADAIEALARGPPPSPRSRSRTRSRGRRPGGHQNRKGKGKGKGPGHGRRRGPPPAAAADDVVLPPPPRLPRCGPAAAADAEPASPARFFAPPRGRQKERLPAWTARTRFCVGAPTAVTRPTHAWAGVRVGEASHPGPPAPATERRERALSELRRAGLVPHPAPPSRRPESPDFHTPRGGPDHCRPALWVTQGPPDPLPLQTAPRSWVYVPLLHDAAGASSDAAQAAWRAHAAFGPVWGQWVGALRAACPQPLTSLHAAVLVHSAAEGRPFVWPERPFRGLQGDSLCTLAFAVEALARADGYLAPAVQEALLCVYGGDRLASEIAEGARHLCAPPAPVPPTDRGAAPAPEADVLSEVAAAAAPRRRARRPRARAPRTSPPPPRPDSRADALWATRDLADEFQRRVYTLQAPPPFLRGALRAALHAGLARIRDDPDSPAGWGLFLLAPRMLLFRRRGETRVARDALEERAALLARGAYADLLDQAAAAAALAPVASPAPRGDCLERRAARAAALAHMGELSAAAAALTAPALAPATAATLAELRDPARRPPSPQVPLPAPPALGRETAGFGVDHARLLANLRRGRRGAAPGLSGCTPEHLRVLLDDAESLDLLCFAADRLARAEVPPEALAALRLGRLVALQKPAGGVRGLVMGDAFRRLVAKTLAQQFAGRFAEVCAPFQYALAARAGTESLARAVRLATELDPRTTVLSIDGVGAYDHISRASMFLGLRDARVAPLLPFVSQFYGAPSRYTFYDEHGAPPRCLAGRGGRAGGPFDARPLRRGPARRPPRGPLCPAARGAPLRLLGRCVRYLRPRSGGRRIRRAPGRLTRPRQRACALGQNPGLERRR